jgi:DNA-binding response OmpR family regulator
MTVKMREKDVELTEVLHNCLKDYLATPLPQDKLNNTINILIAEIRKHSRVAENKIEIGKSFYWDATREQLVYEDELIPLTKKERALLTLLFSDINREFSYNIILSTLWGEVSQAKQDSLKTLVKQLRKKLPRNIIKNIFGFGYTIVVERTLTKTL